MRIICVYIIAVLEINVHPAPLGALGSNGVKTKSLLEALAKRGLIIQKIFNEFYLLIYSA